MIVVLPLKIDIKKLTNYLEEVRSHYPPFMKQDGPWGGWSITSSSGDMYDGWQTGEKIHDPHASIETKSKIAEEFSNKDFSKPTAIYNESIREILDAIEASMPNLKLTRIRIAVLRPHPEETAYWHIDGDSSTPGNAFRLHIPIISNDQCFLEFENERTYMPADGSVYLVDVSRKHRALNLSNQDRFHLIADVHKIQE